MHLTSEALFLLQSLIIIGLPFLLWRLRFIRKILPLVVVQILLGIALGPTVLGRIAPDLLDTLYPSQSLSFLNGLSWMGLALFGFLAGLHFDTKTVRHKGKAFITTSLSSLLLPMSLGVVLALVFSQPPFLDPDVPLWIYILGISTAIAVTALPVLSAILIELKIIGTPLGQRVLGYSVINDMLLWTVVAVLSSYVAKNSGWFLANSSWYFAIIVLLTTIFLAVMFKVFRPMLNRMVRRGQLTENPSSRDHAFILTLIVLCGLTTELIGIHYLFGAFVLGAIIPKSISAGFYHSLEKFTILILMPYFFILTGLKTSFSFSDTDTLLLFICATFVAITAKILGTFVPERILVKSSTSEALQAGALMQTKGLMEIVVLNILLNAGIINTTVFSALVLMAVITTILTKPSLLLIQKLSNNQPVAK